MPCVCVRPCDCGLGCFPYILLLFFLIVLVCDEEPACAATNYLRILVRMVLALAEHATRAFQALESCEVPLQEEISCQDSAVQAAPGLFDDGSQENQK